MTKEELRKSLDFVNEERERLQRELERKDNIINQVVERLKEHDRQYKVFHDGWSDNFILTTIAILEGKYDL